MSALWRDSRSANARDRAAEEQSQQPASFHERRRGIRSSILFGSFFNGSRYFEKIPPLDAYHSYTDFRRALAADLHFDVHFPEPLVLLLSICYPEFRYACTF